MAVYKFLDKVDKNKIFITDWSEIDNRLDPELLLYNKEISLFKYPLIPLKRLLIKDPQYGANETGIERNDIQEPRYIRITDINEFGILKDVLGKTAKTIDEKFILNNNDILFARSGNTVGKSYLHKKDNVNYSCFFAGYMIRFVVNQKIILPDYLFIYTQLEPFKKWVKAIMRTAGQPNINAEEYKNLKIPTPSTLTEQQKIINLYNKAYQTKQQKEQHAKELLNSIDTYLLKELDVVLPKKETNLQSRMFQVNFSEVSGERFDSYYYRKDFKQFFKNLKKGKYPIISLKKASNRITSGITPKSRSDSYTNMKDGIPFIRSGNININGDLNFNDLLHIKKEIHNGRMKSSKVHFQDLMIAIVGATIGQVGIYLDKKEANINQAIALVTLKQNINPFYIKELFKSSIGQYNLNRLKRPVARANINLEEISTMQIILPPKEKQKEIAEHIRGIRLNAKRTLLEANTILENAKQEVEQLILGKNENIIQ